jgi:hypothetical protein
MGTVIPPTYFNCRYLHSCEGVIDPFGFSIGGHMPGDQLMSEVALNLYESYSIMVWGSGSAAADTYTFQGVQLTVGDVSGPMIAQHLVPISGSIASNVPPVNLAVLVTKNTALGGRKNRGRLFLPTGVLFEPEVDPAGQITSGAQAALQQRFEDFLAELQLRDVAPWLLHSHPDDEPTPIMSFSVQSLCATQRRRMR